MEVTKFRSRLCVALEQMTVHLRQQALTVLGRSVAMSRRLEEALRGSTSPLRKLVAISHDVIVATNAKITRELFIGLGQVAIRLRQAQNIVMRLGRSVASKPRRLQEALRARENDLQTLLVSSPDAIVVTNCDRRFVAANPKGLDLFGVSETNMRKFTFETFLCRGQISEFKGHGSPFRRRKVKYGRCEIRRLDGSLRVAECRFFANFVPFRHLYKFRNVMATNQYQPATLRTQASTCPKTRVVSMGRRNTQLEPTLR